MNVTSTSPWTLSQIPSIAPEPGVTPLAQFASTKIPLVSSPGSITSVDSLRQAFQASTQSVRRIDLCPQIGADQSGQLKIIPYGQLPNYVQAGDVVCFLYTDAKPLWDSLNLIEMVKQRGWHAEIFAPNQGDVVLRGAWSPDGHIACTRVEDMLSHPVYSTNPWYANNRNLHVFRFSPPNAADNARFSGLIQGLEQWSAVFPQTTWPSDMAFNPMRFSDLPSLLTLGDALVRKVTPPPTMFCIEWAHAVFCLSCCYPLSQSFLTARGLFSTFTTNFPNVKLLGDTLVPFTTLPWAPYDPAYIIEMFLDAYFEEDLSEDVIAALPSVMAIPSPVILPIVPLLEARKKSNPANFNVSYVCTAVGDSCCVSQ